MGLSLSLEACWIRRQVRPFLSLIVVNLACIVLASALALCDPLILKWLVDVALSKRDLRLVLLGTVIFGIVYLAGLGMSYLTAFVSALVTQKMVFRVRMSLLRRVHALSGKYHANTQVGETLFRVEQDVDRIHEGERSSGCGRLSAPVSHPA